MPIEIDEELRDTFIRPTSEFPELPRIGRVSQIPSRDGYYWLKWPNGRHEEPCEVVGGHVYLFREENDQRESLRMDTRLFTFRPLKSETVD